MINFTIPMKPVAKARPRLTRSGHVYTPKKTTDAEKIVALYARKAIKEPLDGPVWMSVEFTFKMPKSWSKKKKELAKTVEGTQYKCGRPDIDNLFKLIADALNGMAYHDDAQIVMLSALKRYGERDEIRVHIESL